MTSYLQRLVARAGVADRAHPLSAAAVRPRVPARFEPPGGDSGPAGAGPTGEQPVRGDPAGAPARAPAWWTGPLPAVHRGALVEVTEVTEVRPSAGLHRAISTAPVSPSAPWPGLAVVPVPSPDAHDHPGATSGPPGPEHAAPGPPASPVTPPGPGAATGPALAPTEQPDAGRDDRERATTTPPDRPATLPPLPIRPAPPAARRPEVGPRPRTPPAGPAGTDQPVVHVTIGRVEIRTAPPDRHGRAGKPAPPSPDGASGLEDYLVERAGGRGR